MQFDFVNSWKSTVKSWGRIQATLRVGRLTVFEIDYNHNASFIEVMIMNFGFNASWW
jgi:hypothetical protein